uniref:Putative homing endonuclease n=1 Tax=viral metagenome TaxID=1070528 RepID=A0A6M3JYD9_9ZZZZ
MEELWKEIPSHKNYEASNLGRIRHKVGRFNGRKNYGKILKPYTESGYQRVLLCNMRVICSGVHILVAETFIGPRPHKMDIDHIDHDRSNNVLSNLRYITHGENVWRSPYYDGRRAVIDNSPKKHGRFYEDEIATIRDMLSKGIPGSTVAERFKCSPSLISRIKGGSRHSGRGVHLVDK